MVLEHLGYEVLVPKHGCCGLALQSNGLYKDARKYVSKLTNDLRSVNRDARSFPRPVRARACCATRPTRSWRWTRPS